MKDAEERDRDRRRPASAARQVDTAGQRMALAERQPVRATRTAIVKSPNGDPPAWVLWGGEG